MIFLVTLGLQNYAGKSIVSTIIILLSIAVIYLIIKPPISKYKIKLTPPKRNVDEHDTIFARMRLMPNTPEWDAYYSSHPYQYKEDKRARELPGLLSKNSTYHNPLTFTTAESNFDIISYLQKAINHPHSSQNESIDKKKLTEYIKSWAKYLGVHSVGVTNLNDYHLYTKRGRGENKGKEVELRHKFAIAFTVEMEFENVQSAPTSSIIVESTQQYLKSATIALQLATFLKRMGFDSRAHIDGDYELICPLVARDAGLGEIGRMGLLLTPKLGPRVRLAVVTTNAPLVTNDYKIDPTVIEFCRFCKKCADCCPGKSIPKDDISEIDGVTRWKINSELCYQYWCTIGTDCGRCISVCPFSHPNNILHNTIRYLIRKSIIVARLAYIADDMLYGRKPKPKKIPIWMQS